MLKNLKTIKAVLLIVFAFSFNSCEDDGFTENEEKSFQLRTSRVSTNQVINEIETIGIKQNLQKKFYVNEHNNSMLRSNDSMPYFIKKEKDDELTTYILNINSYSNLKPYFLKLIITKNKNEPEKMGFLKYIPSSPITSLNMNSFTGEVQIMDINFEVKATSEYSNGVKQISNQNNNSSNRMTCTDEILITEVKCSNGGGHGVGEVCHDRRGNEIPNDAHYVVSLFTRCTGGRDVPAQIIEDYGNGYDNSPSSFSNTAYLYSFVNNLSQEELAIYVANPSIQAFLVNHLIVVPHPNYNPLLGGDPNIVIIEPEAEEIVKAFFQSALESGLNLDFEKSQKSPAFVDMSSIDASTPEGAKFNLVYEELMKSHKFKELFIDLFQNNDKFNVKFKIGALPNGANGNTDTDLENPTLNLITISPQYLLNKNKMEIAKTIIHECIHAFLNVKLCDAGQGMSISNLNNMDFYNVVNQQYNGFNGGQNQHNFIYNYMIPTMVTILSEVKDSLVTPADNATMLGLSMHIPHNNSPATPFVWNDYYHNLSLNGLQNCNFFQNEIGIFDNQGNVISIINQTLMQSYNQYNYYGHLYLH